MPSRLIPELPVIETHQHTDDFQRVVSVAGETKSLHAANARRLIAKNCCGEMIAQTFTDDPRRPRLALRV
jgi:hypothetical protein